jgi:hypothetical protein
LQSAIVHHTAAASEMKNDFGVAIGLYLEIRSFFTGVSFVVPKALDGIPQFFRRFKFLVVHAER